MDNCLQLTHRFSCGMIHFALQKVERFLEFLFLIFENLLACLLIGIRNPLEPFLSPFFRLIAGFIKIVLQLQQVRALVINYFLILFIEGNIGLYLFSSPLFYHKTASSGKYPLPLFYRHTLRQIPRHIGVVFAQYGELVC